ncbi:MULTISPECIES: hypothetical protein [unclassified Nonomuraea]|uniref:hypothetical protein n=1 Tax=Nonomuraea sp. NPDC003804 TaxID=3154547 RepID=UPI0033AE8338
MSTQDERRRPEDELRRLDEDIAKLKGSTAEIRAQVRDMGATDAIERAAMLSMADEQDVLISELEVRRERLRARLGSS